MSDAYRALENLEHYLHDLEEKPDSEELKLAVTKAVATIRSRLFRALLGKSGVELRVGKGWRVCLEVTVFLLIRRYWCAACLKVYVWYIVYVTFPCSYIPAVFF